MPVAWVILPEKYELLEKRGYTYGAHCNSPSNVSYWLQSLYFLSATGTTCSVDNHVSILLIKNTRGIQKENSYCPGAAVGLKQRTVTCPQDSLQTGGPKTGDSPPSRYSTTTANNSVYNSSLRLLSTTPLYRASYRLPGRSAYHVYYYYRHLPRTTLPKEPRTPRSIVPRTLILY
jgi:hypothetical protein